MSFSHSFLSCFLLPEIWRESRAGETECSSWRLFWLQATEKSTYSSLRENINWGWVGVGWGGMGRLLAHITELPWDMRSQEWLSLGVPAVIKVLALFLDDSLFCFVGFILSGLLSSYPHITKLKRETDELFLSVSESSPHISLVCTGSGSGAHPLTNHNG